VRFQIKNVGIDIYETSRTLVGANAITCTTQYGKLRSPMISPHQSELSKSDLAKIPLNSSLFQYVHIPRKDNKVNEKNTKETITNDYKKWIDKYPKLITDFYYQYYPDYPPTIVERNAILDIQRDAGAKILSDYETNPEQTVEKFEEQILSFRNDNKKYIPSPTLDIDIRTIGLFTKKLDKILEHKFQRFNVIFRSLLTYQVNWIDLSHRLLQKNIWCNVVGVPQRFLSGTNPISLLSVPFLYGVHSTSLGYPIIRNKKTKKKIQKYSFNNNTYTFDKIFSASESENRTTSFNEHVDELKIARKHIINRKFYSQYIPSKSGLLEILNNIP
jgi:hypothetical protein